MASAIGLLIGPKGRSVSSAVEDAILAILNLFGQLQSLGSALLVYSSQCIAGNDDVFVEAVRLLDFSFLVRLRDRSKTKQQKKKKQKKEKSSQTEVPFKFSGRDVTFLSTSQEPNHDCMNF